MNAVQILSGICVDLQYKIDSILSEKESEAKEKGKEFGDWEKRQCAEKEMAALKDIQLCIRVLSIRDVLESVR